MATVLTAAGHQALQAEDGREGLRLLEAHAEVSLLITDLIMPEMDGIELIVCARKKWPQLPIVAISGGSLHSATCLNAAKNLGAIETLGKPFGRNALLTAVTHSLGKESPINGS
jgi:CheY-like chemotaxis protein